ncbi:carboxypeptidase regulatory-like domain-containing protein [bacterium]|nr:carboxypeptidase regulatory-like domain-containing protein [bacterium]
MKSSKALTLIDVLIGIALTLVIFLGIFGLFQLTLKVIGQSQARITATAIANQEIEKIRNLPYEDIGVQGGFPDGVLPSVTTTISGGREYTIETRVDFVVDPDDGVASPEDECPNDYKRVKVKVSWQGKFGGEVEISTDISPPSLAQECGTSGGILSVSVFDAYGMMVPFPSIEVRDPSTDALIKTAVPAEGHHYFSLPTSTYKVVVTKNGFSTERTYGTDEIATPQKPHPIVLDKQTTEISFSIDELSSFSVDTVCGWGVDRFSDSFDNEAKISESSNVLVEQGKATLATTTGGYFSSGYLISTSSSPTDILSWDEFSWTDSEPQNSDLKYQIYYASGSNWYLIPDSDLPGNSTGFDTSPVDLSGLSTTTYSELKLKANFSTSDPSTTSELYDWQLSWISSQTTSIGNVQFLLQGAKIIGTDADENPVYKYSQTHVSDNNGHVDIPDLEWDSYTFSVSPSEGLDLVNTDPSPQPISLPPDNALKHVTLYLEAENSLLVTVENSDTLEPIFSATVRLFNTGLGYDVSQYTDQKGETFFIPLQSAVYNLEVQAPGYSSTSLTVGVTGDTTKTILLDQIE